MRKKASASSFQRMRLALFVVQLVAVETLLVVTPFGQRRQLDRSFDLVCYSTAASRGKSRAPADSSSSSSSPAGRIEFVDFWGTHTRSDAELGFELPVDPRLDRYDGSLPPGAYRIHGKPEYDPKPACRIALSIDWEQRHSRFARFPLGPEEVVRQVQNCIDAGFQTFQLSPEARDAENVDMIGRIMRDTPTFVEMHWIVRLELPKIVSPATVREAVFGLLRQTRTESLDTVLVPFDSGILPQYHLDVLDSLQDLQRDGLVRSIGVVEWPETLLKQAYACGFAIGVHQQSGNLLLPPPRNRLRTDTASWWSNPLARNFLSDNANFLTGRDPPTHAKGWKDIQTWYDLKQQKKKRGKQDTGKAARSLDAWNSFKKDVQETLRHLAWKHEVSIDTIILRWSLQENLREDRILPASMVLFPLFFVEEPEGQLGRQLSGLRDVFRFELDQDDLELLNDIVALPKPKTATLRIDEVDVPVDDIPAAFLKEFEAMTAGQEDEDSTEGDEHEEYPKIDFSNPALWL